ncbi:hypothetical protein BDN71DRAFT_1508726 [Pleurotus eryngii]|uniref:Uncharacterized protein n=1 Tax=Pleurotus eryngii TaxID=5323 RepID=A0A9P5ZS52_PLEER|nr:hypothetical protein BDN71DRAFT_1508726 [Pleurotus eryngii]
MQNNDSTVQAKSTFALRDESTNERMEVLLALIDLIRYEYEKEKIKAAMEVDMTNDDKLPLIHRDMSFIGKYDIQVPANPSPTKAQITKLHASIKAVQEWWGIFYKDTAQQLYLQKMVKIQAEMEEVEQPKVMMMRVCQLINETI